jgi:hypothetical protein
MAVRVSAFVRSVSHDMARQRFGGAFSSVLRSPFHPSVSAQPKMHLRKFPQSVAHGFPGTKLPELVLEWLAGLPKPHGL